MPKRYLIHLRPGRLKDEASVRRHIAADDYFGTIATVLSLIKQELKNRSSKETALIETTLKNLERDLVFLQKNCHISYRRTGANRQTRSALTHNKPSIKKRKSKPKGKLMSQ